MLANTFPSQQPGRPSLLVVGHPSLPPGAEDLTLLLQRSPSLLSFYLPLRKDVTGPLATTLLEGTLTFR